MILGPLQGPWCGDTDSFEDAWVESSDNDALKLLSVRYWTMDTDVYHHFDCLGYFHLACVANAVYLFVLCVSFLFC